MTEMDAIIWTIGLPIGFWLGLLILFYICWHCDDYRFP
jgi:hypothetical protein